jgi:hypothetical protein
MGYSLGEALELIKKARPVAEFLPVYLKAVERLLKIERTGCRLREMGARQIAWEQRDTETKEGFFARLGDADQTNTLGLPAQVVFASCLMPQA